MNRQAFLWSELHSIWLGECAAAWDTVAVTKGWDLLPVQPQAPTGAMGWRSPSPVLCPQNPSATAPFPPAVSFSALRIPPTSWGSPHPLRLRPPQRKPFSFWALEGGAIPLGTSNTLLVLRCLAFYPFPLQPELSSVDLNSLSHSLRGDDLMVFSISVFSSKKKSWRTSP